MMKCVYNIYLITILPADACDDDDDDGCWFLGTAVSVTRGCGVEPLSVEDVCTEDWLAGWGAGKGGCLCAPPVGCRPASSVLIL